jgi:hypothetical protein
LEKRKPKDMNLLGIGIVYRKSRSKVLLWLPKACVKRFRAVLEKAKKLVTNK